jgi:hypothetical protein
MCKEAAVRLFEVHCKEAAVRWFEVHCKEAEVRWFEVQCKEAEVRWFVVHCQRLPGWTEESHVNPIKITGLLVEIWNRYPKKKVKFTYLIPKFDDWPKYERDRNNVVNFKNTYGLEKPVVTQTFL